MQSMIDGVKDHNGHTWLKCPECGDSIKSRRCHMMVDSKGSCYCFRCGYSSQLSVEALIGIALGDSSIDEELEGLGHEDTHPVSSLRKTALETYGEEGRDVISFQMRDHNGTVVGWHDREPGMKGLNTGRRGLGYVGDKLTSSPSSPLVIVEGPYDVISDRHVCVFGMITPSAVKYLRLQYVWLQPDPDQIDTIAGRAKFLERVITPIRESMTFLEGIIVGNADPDEATITKHFSVEDTLVWR